MIIDTSVLMAVLLSEAEQDEALNILKTADGLHIAAGTYMEAAILTQHRIGHQGVDELDLLIDLAGIRCAHTTKTHVHLMKEAYHRYGKGQQNKAQLNFGDCFAYALAKDLDQTLLFKGDDFIHTDVKLMRLGV